ncbi:MAG: hypothetical protein G01um101417_193 [Parcubacteria group bacterium Gr01-1014_17]|nr:MAG: hypothetical protein G01um101417_193 [Parcubacteria group bacterium Gr01-1014_17]
MKRPITDRIAIERALERSIAAILPSREELIQALSSGKRLRFYIGCDPTGPNLHIGHATNFLLLERLRKLGHEIIVLFGDFTARIGDPTEKESVRKVLTEKEITENIKTWKEQVGRALNLNDPENSVRIELNSKWLSALGFSEIVDLASAFTVQQMLERDMFEKRWKDEKPIYLHEFFYPLMQGYDSVALDVDAEMGGNDQLFNMLTGRILLKKYKNKEKFVITTTLLINPKTGKKLMNKSEGDYVALSAKPSEMFGGVMALPDAAITQLFIDCTEVPLSEIEEFKQKIKNGTNPRDIKARLAKEVVSLFHSKNDAEDAEKEFNQAFRDGKPSEFVAVALEGKTLANTLIEKKIIESKTELRRLIAEGAVTHIASGEKMGEEFLKKQTSGEYRIGKHRFVRIKV